MQVAVTDTKTAEPADTNAEMNAETNGPLEASASVGEVERGVNWPLVAGGVFLATAVAVVWSGR